jgi:hypothetical protein
LFASRGEGAGVTATRETNLELVISNVQDRLAELQVLVESACGGIFQQLFKWTANLMEQLSDELMSSSIESLPKEQQALAVITHIMGMPAWALLGVTDELNRKISFLSSNSVE